jgi:hypothetical protein
MSLKPAYKKNCQLLSGDLKADYQKMRQLFSVVDDEITLSPKYFSCCGGSGINSSTNVEVSFICPVKSRFHRFLKNLNMMRRLTNLSIDAALQFSAFSWWQPAMKNLAQYKRGSDVKGVSFLRTNTEISPFWQLGLYASFFLDLDIVIMDFSNFIEKKKLPKFGDNKLPKLLMIAGVDKMWDPDRYMAFEQLLSLCGNSEVNIWVDFIATSSSLPQKKYGARSQFWNVIRSNEGKHPSHFLSPKGKSLLDYMCAKSDVVLI